MKLTEFIEDYTRQGKIGFSRDEALEKTELSESAFYKATSRLQQQNRLIQPRQGFFVIVRAEHRSVGGPPASHYIDQLMNYLKEPYYVGVLSAASMHGAAHHAPQVFQVVVQSQLRTIKEKRTKIQFLKNKYFDAVPLERKKVPTGYVQISTSEATLVDVIYYRKQAGGLDNAANILIKLAESNLLEPSKLFEAAIQMHDTSTVQRLGYMLDKFGFIELAEPLERWIQKQQPARTPLAPGIDRYKGNHDKTWRVLVNRSIEPDVVVG